MALSWKARRRWSLVILLIGLPAYVVAAVTVVGLFDRPPFWVELVVYVALGIVWALPFRFVFRGIGQPDPDARTATPRAPSAQEEPDAADLAGRKDDRGRH
ncbi:DUF2842 domain-containing protein [Rhodovulum steppense]|uniref:Uncharacterized protein DUF2842 n=1 Tax=Rhodovulum steppense TaxID=540251 RepID=A0A4R1YV32_9RHOB|nr:DUF2842 domain-containing protein [Rhodovulum steppense]TCM84959.1 uncharacterized protein DUF2842 [Rhodovulum steppense]